jgi:hypothetical protein
MRSSWMCWAEGTPERTSKLTADCDVGHCPLGEPVSGVSRQIMRRIKLSMRPKVMGVQHDSEQ